MQNNVYALQRLIIVFSVLSVFLSFSGYAQTFEFEGKRKKYGMDFKLAQNLIIVPLYVNGEGPYNFLLDTGVGQMIITDTSFAKAYENKNFKKIKIQGYGFGEEVEAILTRDVNVKLGKLAINKIPTAIFLKDIFDLSNYLGVRIYGILGYYLFNSFIVKINYNTHRITFYDPDSKVKIKGLRIPMQIRNTKPYIKAEVQTPATGATTLELLIDNGSSHPMMLESLEHAPFPLPPNTIPANLGVGINGIISGSMGRIDSVKIGDYKFDKVLSGLPTFNEQVAKLEGYERNGSIGADILRHFVVTFDYQHEAMYLKKNHRRKIKFDHDMSGMEIYMLYKPETTYYIGRIEPGSPAEVAGLRPNDRIISINFKPVESFTLSELTELLKSGDGRHLILEVLRGKERHIAIVKLKIRI
jgi:hypothetical protein